MGRLSLLVLLAIAPAAAQIAYRVPEDVASLAPGRAESRIGNSVDAATGAFVYARPLLSVSGARSLDFFIAYNSLMAPDPTFDSLLGPGWTHPFDGHIQDNGDGTVSVQIMHQRNRYQAKPGCDPKTQICTDQIRDTQYTPLDEGGQYDTLVQNAAHTLWTLTRPDGTTYYFEPFGNNILLTRVANEAGQAIDAFHLPLNSPFLPGQLAYASEPVTKKTITLYHSNGKLAAVSTGDAAVLFDYNADGQLASTAGPVKLDTFTATAGVRPFTGTSLDFPINVSLGQDPYMGSVAISGITLSHPHVSQMHVFLISPENRSIDVTSATFVYPGSTVMVSNERFFSDFAGTARSGTWHLRFTVPTAGNGSSTGLPTLAFTPPLQRTHYFYGPGSRLTLATDPDGKRLFSNEYDASGRVVSQDDGIDTNQIATFVYSAPPNSIARTEIDTTYTDRMGKRYLFRHDSGYHLLSITDPLGHTVSYTYSPNGDRTGITDQLGNKLSFAYDEKGNLVSFTDAAGATTTIGYDQYRHLTQIMDSTGNATKISWTNAAPVPGGGALPVSPQVVVTDALKNTTVLDYTKSFQLERVEIALRQLVYSYDQKDDGGLLTNMTFVHDPNVLLPSRTISYDSRGWPIEVQDAGSGPRYALYDGAGRPESLEVSSTLSEAISYDSRGRKKDETFTFNLMGTTRYVGFEYDGNDNLIQLTEIEFRVTAGQHRVTQFSYDGEDRLIAETGPEGNTTRYTYDAAGQMVSVTDPEGVTTTREYDAAGNLSALRNASGGIISQTTYDARGLPLSVKDAAGRATKLTYDILGRLTAIEDPAGQITRRSYDQLGRLVKVDQPGRGAFTREYDAFGNLSRITGPDNYAVSISQDFLGRVTAVQTPDGQSAVFTHDGRNLLVHDESKGGRSIRDYDYTDDGRLSHMSATGADGPDIFRAYSYDGFGNREVVFDQANAHAAPVARLQRTFTEERMTSYTDNVRNKRIDYGYDKTGNLTSMTYPPVQGSTQTANVAYSYDHSGRLIGVSDWAGRKTRYRYDAQGRTTRIDLPNGTWREMQYDSAGQVTARSDFAPSGETIVSYRYTYDRSGKVASVQSAPAFSVRPPFTADMSYVPGNLASRWSFVNLQHDSEGNLLTSPVLPPNADANSYPTFATVRYDALHEVISAGLLTYRYDEEGRLVGFTTLGHDTALTVSPGPGISRIIDKTDTTGTTRYVWGVGLLYEDGPSGLLVYHYDQRGNTVAVTDSAGRVIGRAAYSPYGEVLYRDSSVNTPFLFGGLFGVFTDPNGLNYMRFRWYSPLLKRFLNQDARFGDLTVGGSLNRFSYGFGDPINFVDPDGQFAEILLGAVGGGLVGAVAEIAVELSAGHSLNDLDWQKVGVGFTAGAVAGALTAACGLWCGAYVKSGIFFANAAVSGAASAADSLLDGKPPRADQVLFDAALGGALGVVGGARAGRAERELLENASRAKNAVVPVRISALLPNQMEIAAFVKGAEAGQESLLRGAVGETAGFVSDVSTQAGAELLSNALFGSEDAPPDSRAETYITNLNRAAAPRRELNGRQAHYQLFLKALELANRPFPSNPNNIMTGF